MTAKQFRLFIAIVIALGVSGCLMWLAYQPTRRINQCASLRGSFGYENAREYCAELDRQGLLSRN